VGGGGGGDEEDGSQNLNWKSIVHRLWNATL